MEAPPAEKRAEYTYRFPGNVSILAGTSSDYGDGSLTVEGSVTAASAKLGALMVKDKIVVDGMVASNELVVTDAAIGNLTLTKGLTLPDLSAETASIKSLKLDEKVTVQEIEARTGTFDVLKLGGASYDKFPSLSFAVDLDDSKPAVILPPGRRGLFFVKATAAVSGAGIMFVASSPGGDAKEGLIVALAWLRGLKNERLDASWTAEQGLTVTQFGSASDDVCDVVML